MLDPPMFHYTTMILYSANDSENIHLQHSVFLKAHGYKKCQHLLFFLPSPWPKPIIEMIVDGWIMIKGHHQK